MSQVVTRSGRVEGGRGGRGGGGSGWSTPSFGEIKGSDKSTNISRVELERLAIVCGRRAGYAVHRHMIDRYGTRRICPNFVRKILGFEEFHIIVGCGTQEQGRVSVCQYL